MYRESGSMAQAMIVARAAARTSQGRVRSGNEDAFGYQPEHGIYIVCDGMGGAAGGEVASRMTVDIVLQRMGAADGAGSGRDRLHAAIAEANHAVLERAEREPGLYGMGTTLVALLLADGPARIVHAGDSRCYLLRAGRLEQLTQDHSLVDEQIRLGTMTAEEAARSPFRSVITRAIGTQPTVSEDAVELDVEKGDLFLLCSDGLTREVDEERIARILSADDDLEQSAQTLVDAANEAGGRDNVTCLLVQVQPAGSR
ncbi:MAG TPA: Stp1/IreP family PP2C-type Ser/Thr phosphatase [Acidobacteriaceae bacterium]|nr:Stp1/IreP family PP2C-type Ser/Thr phosphatase [Acidobacteriaceae bacterium]